MDFAKDLTPAEDELLKAINKNANNGMAHNMRRIAIKHGIDYYQALAYKKRLVNKGMISSSRCGLGCKCPVTIVVKGNKS